MPYPGGPLKLHGPGDQAAAPIPYMMQTFACSAIRLAVAGEVVIYPLASAIGMRLYQWQSREM